MFSKRVTSEYEVSSEYKKISIEIKNASVKIIPSDNEKTKMVFLENKKRPYEFFVEDGTLTVKPKKKKWYNLLSVGFKRDKISICIPNKACEELLLKCVTGKIELSSIVCGGIFVKSNTANVSLNDCAAREICVKTNTGSVCGRLPKNTAFTCTSNAGKIKIPKPNIGETVKSRCEIKTNTGKIEFE